MTTLKLTNWMLCYNDKKIPASVPGDITIDLFKAGIVKDPYYGFNYVENTWIARTDFTYECELNVDENLLNQEVDYSKDIISIMVRLRRDNDRTITIKTNDYDNVISVLTKMGAANSYIHKEYYDTVISEPTVSAEEATVYYEEGAKVQEIY